MLLQLMQEEQEPRERKLTYDVTIMVEAQLAELAAYCERYNSPNPFKVGDVVTPLPNFNIRGCGQPHVVMESLAEPFRYKGEFGHIENPGHPMFHSLYDTRVASYTDNNTIMTWWMHHSILEMWSPDKNPVRVPTPKKTVSPDHH